ncbi:MAG: hypothetical protein ACK457_12965 [Flavobacteriia bacterium]|jgi:hypothetical protein
MKALILLVTLFVSSISFGQLINGTLVDEGRKMVSTSDFSITDPNEGVLFYELAVNRKGIVTSARLLSEGTTVVSTPTRIKVRNYLMTLTFEEGTYYPEFHHVTVKVTTRRL